MLDYEEIKIIPHVNDDEYITILIHHEKFHIKKLDVELLVKDLRICKKKKVRRCKQCGEFNRINCWTCM